MERLTYWTGYKWIARLERLNGRIVGDRDIYNKLAEYEDLGLEPKELMKLLLRCKANEAKNKPIFKWHKCKRRNGTEFLKLIWYSNDAGGYVEVGRFNMSKSEFVENTWTLDDILGDLN